VCPGRRAAQLFFCAAVIFAMRCSQTASAGPAPTPAAAGKTSRTESYPITTRLDDTLIGMQGVVYLELGDDALGVSAFFQIFNLGASSWMPSNIVIDLPRGFTSLKVDQAPGKPGFDEIPGLGVRLVGTYAPGQHDTHFRFQMPYSSTGSLAFSISLPPRTGQVRVIAEATPGTKLAVSGFPKPVMDRDPSGRRVLSTDRTLAKGEGPLRTLDIMLTGMPAHARVGWWLLAFAVAILATGIAAAFRMHRTHFSNDDLLQARFLLTGQIIELDDAHDHGMITTAEHDELRRLLLDALGSTLDRD